MSVRGEGDSKATWKEIENTSFILLLQISIIKSIVTWRFDLPFWPIFRFYLCYFVFKRNWTTRYLEFKVLFFSFNDFRKGKSCRALHKLFTYLLVRHILSNRLEKRDCLKSYFQFAYTCWRTTAKESRFCRERTRSPESPVSDLGQSESCNWKSGALTVSQTHTHTWTFSLTICLQCWSMPLMKYSV